MTTYQQPPQPYYPQQQQVLPPNAPIPQGAVPVGQPQYAPPTQQTYAPPPQYAQPQQQQYVPQGQPPQPHYAPPPQHGAPPSPPSASPPPVQLPPVMALPQNIYVPDDALVAQAYALAQAEAERVAAQRAAAGNRWVFFSPPAPNGTMQWDASVPVGFQSSATVWVCPSWAPGTMPYTEGITHFWKSRTNPKGISILCLGEGRCPICAARNALFKTGREEDAERAKQTGRAKKGYIYNVLWLDNPASHVNRETGKMLPHVLRAGVTLHQDMLNIFAQLGGIARFVTPQLGRPLILTKKKKGVEDRDIEWPAPIPKDPCALPPQFNAALYNLHDLTKVVGEPGTQADYVKAITEMSLVMDTPEVHSLLAQIPSGNQPQQSYGIPTAPQGYAQQPASQQPQYAQPQPQYAQPQQASQQQYAPQGQPSQPQYAPPPPQYQQQVQAPPPPPPYAPPPAPTYGQPQGQPPPAPGYYGQNQHPTNAPADHLRNQVRGGTPY